MLKKLVLVLALGLVVLSACSQADPGVSLEEKEFKYFRCVEKRATSLISQGISKDYANNRAKSECLYHLD
jgi:hypothetical protein